MKVFIQNEASSLVKHNHNEKTLEPLGVTAVSRPYPFPYGFIIGTSAADGCNVDCFVITKRYLASGTIVECDAIGLMRQIEDQKEDHNVLAALPDEGIEADESTRALLIEFVQHVFDHIEGKQIRVGEFQEAAEALRHIESCGDVI